MQHQFTSRGGDCCSTSMSRQSAINLVRLLTISRGALDDLAEMMIVIKPVEPDPIHIGVGKESIIRVTNVPLA